MATDRVILGIDPGTNIMGYGIVHVINTKLNLIDLGVLQMGKTDGQALKLKEIFEKMISLIEKHKPDELAIEAPFFGKNVQSMLKLGRAQGVAIAAALSKKIPVTEYSPKKIKQSITGSGNASKEQVAAMLNSLMRINEKPKYLDATDALAVAVCHYFQRNGKTATNKSYSGWKTFLSENPDRKI